MSTNKTMTNNAMILAMLEMQDELNSIVDKDWKYRNREWYRAIWIECAEAIEHEGTWKWWKKQEPNMDQVKMELVDIWHFLLSWVIQDGECDICELMHDPMTAGTLISNIEAIAQYSSMREIEDTVFHFSNALALSGMTIADLYAMYAGKFTLNAFRQDNGYKDGSYRKTWHDGREDNEHLIEILGSLSGVLIDEDFQPNVYERLGYSYAA